MKFLIVPLILCSSLFCAEYSAIHDPITGKAVAVKRERDGASIPIALDNSDYQEFLRWNAAQKQDRITVVDQAPDPIPASEIERQRRLSVAIATLKAIPDSWETDGNQQHLFMWSIKQAFLEIRRDLMN